MIIIYEAATEKEIIRFRQQLTLYFQRDIFPEPTDENLDYFLGKEYQAAITNLHNRTQDRCRFLFFMKNGQEIGFAMPVIYGTEDGKCFIMEFCVYPDFRGNGTGTECARVLLDWAKSNGARYAELNFSRNERRRHFWQNLGFLDNGVDEWGEPLMLLPPEEELSYTVELLHDPEEWQLLKLENGYLAEIGEDSLSEEKQKRLQQAIRDGKIYFFVARRGYRIVGMCSAAKCWSTFSCSEIASFEDFYIEPVFRKKGIARKLTEAAQAWCRENGISSLTVCCAPCDEEMYQALGFDVRLGTTFGFLNSW